MIAAIHSYEAIAMPSQFYSEILRLGQLILPSGTYFGQHAVAVAMVVNSRIPPSVNPKSHRQILDHPEFLQNRSPRFSRISFNSE